MPGRDGVEASRAPAASLQRPVEITFGEYYYGHDCGVPYERNDHWLGFFGRIAERIVTELRPTSVLDAGCAMGMLVEALHARGVDAWGIDISEYAISKVAPEVADRCRVGSLTDPLDGRFDLVTCIEVLEHMPSDDSYVALKNLCHASDRILFSSSPNDYAEPSHVNVRPPEWWSAQFAALGFLRNTDYDASYVAPWTVLYERREELRLSDVVDRLRPGALAAARRGRSSCGSRCSRCNSGWRRRAPGAAPARPSSTTSARNCSPPAITRCTSRSSSARRSATASGSRTWSRRRRRPPSGCRRCSTPAAGASASR